MLSDSFDVRDARFTALVFENVHVERLWTGARWTEGPAYVAAGKYLLFSDIPNDKVLRWDETSGAVSVFETPCGHQNGRTVDPAGRVLACEHSGRRVCRREHDGSLTVLASDYQGKPLNSPNDVVVRSDGSIWFTDPTYGIDSDYEGEKADSAIGASYVYRIDPQSREVKAVATDFSKPNGLAFSLDETKLYVSDTGLSHAPDGPRHIRVLDVAPDGTSLADSRVFATCDNGGFDGFRLDGFGNVWASAGDGVHCFAPDGTLLGKIKIPEVVANVEFGGPALNRLFMTATQSLYAVYLRTNGARNLARRKA